MKPDSVAREKGGNADLVGPLHAGPAIAQASLLEYPEGKPTDELAWGRAPTRADIIKPPATRLLE